MTPISGLFTDLYELAMAQVYYERGLEGPAVFELTARSLPADWGFLLAAGLSNLLERVEALRFNEDDLAYLRSLSQFTDGFIDRLRKFRFSGEIWAPPEGTVVFPHEPLLQVVAPLPEAQLLETLALNQLSSATLVASKAARAVLAADGAPMLEFGGRRAHGVDAALIGACAAYSAGFEATSNVEAGRRFGIPVVGTMAHSYVLAYDDELEAFRSFARRYPATTLLVDTHDTTRGVENVITLAQQIGQHRIRAIRIDSGDLGEEARAARAMLDAAKLTEIQIIASGGLDEHRIAALVAARAPIDAFACGTAIVTSQDAPALDTAYKLVAYEDRDLAKHSPGKPSLGGRKQVYRRREQQVMVEDHIQRFGMSPRIVGKPLLKQMMVNGRRARASEVALSKIRLRAADQIDALPDAQRRIVVEREYSVTIDDSLRGLGSERAVGL